MWYIKLFCSTQRPRGLNRVIDIDGVDCRSIELNGRRSTVLCGYIIYMGICVYVEGQFIVQEAILDAKLPEIGLQALWKRTLLHLHGLEIDSFLEPKKTETRESFNFSTLGPFKITLIYTSSVQDISLRACTIHYCANHIWSIFQSYTLCQKN